MILYSGRFFKVVFFELKKVFQFDYFVSMQRSSRAVKYLSYLVAAFWFMVSGCQQKDNSQEKVLVWMERGRITLPEFRSFYELDPNFGIDSSGYEALLDELNKMISHKLAYLKAEQDGLLQDSQMQKFRNWELSQAMSRELYRQVAESKVRITEEEIRKVYVESTTLVHVRHLFSKDSLQIESWREKVVNGTPFQALSRIAFQDTFLAQNGGDLGWMKISDFDTQFAESIKTLSKGEISRPVKTKWGYHIIQLLDGTRELSFSEDDYLKQKPGISKKLVSRKGQEIARQFIIDYIGKRNPQPDPEVFQKLWAAIAKDAAQEKEIPISIMFTNELIDQLKFILAKDLESILIRYQGGSVLLGEFLLSLEDIPISNRMRIQSRLDLSHKIAIWIRDKLLLQEAYRRDLDHDPGVEKEVIQSIEKQAYLYYLQQEAAKLEVPLPVTDYFTDPRTGADPVLQKFHTLEEWKWWQAEKALVQNLRSSASEIKIDTVLLKQENQQMDWQRTVRMFAFPRPQ